MTPAKAWQRIIRETAARNAGGIIPTEQIKLAQIDIRPISRSQAAQMIFEYEWLGTMSRSSLHFGAFWKDALCAVVCLGKSDGWAHRTLIKYGLSQGEVWVLSRGATAWFAPPNISSKLVAHAINYLRKENNAKAIIAYADSDAGEIGTIYQATNWIYLGVLPRSAEGFISPRGQRFHRNIVYDSTRKLDKKVRPKWKEAKQALLDAGWTTYTISDKHRYVFALDKGLRRRLIRDAKPYPHRNIEHDP